MTAGDWLTMGLCFRGLLRLTRQRLNGVRFVFPRQSLMDVSESSIHYQPICRIRSRMSALY
jgi:hypothetical protein